MDEIHISCYKKNCYVDDFCLVWTHCWSTEPTKESKATSNTMFLPSGTFRISLIFALITLNFWLLVFLSTETKYKEP